jgi:hypothetical protein
MTEVIGDAPKVQSKEPRMRPECGDYVTVTVSGKVTDSDAYDETVKIEDSEGLNHYFFPISNAIEIKKLPFKVGARYVDEEGDRFEYLANGRFKNVRSEYEYLESQVTYPLYEISGDPIEKAE